MKDFWHIEVAKFSFAITGQENVSTLQVPMTDFGVVEGFKTQDHLWNNWNDLLVAKIGAIPCMFSNFLVEISIIGVLHDQA